MTCDSIPFTEIPLHNQLIRDYLSEDQRIASLISDFPSYDSIIRNTEKREFNDAQRTVLFNALEEQYRGIELSNEVRFNLDSIKRTNTYTITTGHQLCLNTGPIYLIYKIASVISLTKTLNTKQSEFHYVPMFWLASEDHDFEEINHFRIFNEMFSWKKEKNGAVGNLKTDSIIEIIDQARNKFNNNDSSSEWWDMSEKAYQSEDLSSAMRVLINELFADYGLLIIDGNDQKLKSEFKSIMKQELFAGKSKKLIDQQIEYLKKENYKVQVNPREINLFYLFPEGRERIIRNENGVFNINSTEISFSEKQMENELDNHPEKFSPNVVLRPMYQESILPNVATIGGGGEISYWLELKSAFEAYTVPFPIVLVRDSAVFMGAKSARQLEEAGFKYRDLFKKAEDIEKSIASKEHVVDFKKYKDELDSVIMTLKKEVEAISKGLISAVEIEQKNVRKGIEKVENKVIKELKNKHEVQIKRILKIRNEWFPVGIFQERYINPVQLLLSFDSLYLNELIDEFNPLDKKLRIIIVE